MLALALVSLRNSVESIARSGFGVVRNVMVVSLLFFKYITPSLSARMSISLLLTCNYTGCSQLHNC